MKQFIIFGIAVVVLFLNCSSSDNLPFEESDSQESKNEQQYKTVAYLPTWKKDFVPDWGKITHLCLAFGQVQANGEIDMSGIDKMKSTIKLGKANNVKILLSVGGGGTKNFSEAILNQETRIKFVDNLSDIVIDYEFDGIDIDFEEWDGGENGASESDLVKRTALEATYKALRSKLGEELLITAAVSASWDKGNGEWGYYNCFNNSMHEYLDFVNLMIYDQTGPWPNSEVGPHSSWDFYQNSIKHWLNNRQLPKEKLIAGVPFYGYQFKSAESSEGAVAISYGEILQNYLNQDVHLKDNVGMIYYDGMLTIEKKTKYIKENKLGGIMIWEVSHDSKDVDKSLLNVIDATFKD